MCLKLVHLQSIFKSQTPVSVKYIYPLGEMMLFRKTILDESIDLS